MTNARLIALLLVLAGSATMRGWGRSLAYEDDLTMGFSAAGPEEAAAMRSIQRRFHLGHVDAATVALDSLEACVGERDESEAILRVWLARARLLELEQRFPEALALVVEVTREARALGEASTLALAYLQRELIHEHLGNADLAEAALRTADSVIVAEGLRSLAATYAVRAASLYRTTGEPERARSYARVALGASRESGRRLDEADAHFLLAVLDPRDDYAAQERHLRIATAIARDLGDASMCAYHLINRAGLAAESGRYRRALALTDTAVAYIAHVAEAGFSDVRYTAVLYSDRARFFRELGRLDSAYVNLERSAALETAYAYALNDEEVMRIEREMAVERSRGDLLRQAAVLEVERSRARYLLAAAVLLALLGAALTIYALRLRAARRQIRREVARQVTLRAEMQHRVKNNLQVLISLLEVQGERASNPAAADEFAGMAQRVHGLAKVHEQLNLHEGDEHVDAREYLDEVVGGYAATFSGARILAVDLDIEPVALPTRMLMPVAIALNELIVNSVKHARAATAGEPLRITIVLGVADGAMRLDYRDNGAPPREEASASPVDEGVGLYLVRSMVRQLRGSLEYGHAGGGFAVAIEIAAPGLGERLVGGRALGSWWSRGRERDAASAPVVSPEPS